MQMLPTVPVGMARGDLIWIDGVQLVVVLTREGELAFAEAPTIQAESPLVHVIPPVMEA